MMVRDWSIGGPLLAFYLLLVINTFFSVKFFSSLTSPADPYQKWVDGVLVLIYLALATQMGSPISFLLIASLLFLVACVKYSLLFRDFEYPRLLFRKIAVNIFGAILCLLTLLWFYMRYSHIALIAFPVLFAIANIYLLFIRPLYTLETRRVNF